MLNRDKTNKERMSINTFGDIKTNEEFYFIKSRDQILNCANPSFFIMVAYLPNALFFSDPSQTEW